MNMFSKKFWSQMYVLSMLYPLSAHRIIKVDSILYQKFALWNVNILTFSAWGATVIF